MKKIYCAGPLFNSKEREEMREIANLLEGAGYRVFLPQRDGIELAKSSELLAGSAIPVQNHSWLLSKVIFYIDIYQIADSDGIVINLNGRVPDEGAMVEAGIAWTLGKPIILFKCDSRTAFDGFDNPLVAGLAQFKTIKHKEGVVQAFNDVFANGFVHRKIDFRREEYRPFRLGRLIYRYYQKSICGGLSLAANDSVIYRLIEEEGRNGNGKGPHDQKRKDALY